MGTPAFSLVNQAAESGAGKNLLKACCNSSDWVDGMLARCPFSSDDDLYSSAEEVWWGLEVSSWREAFAGHPKIGDMNSLRAKFADTAHLASAEQASVATASEETLLRLAEGNRKYEEKFGFIFIICATGKSAGEMLKALDDRMNHSREEELVIAAEEQMKITRLRLGKLGQQLA